MAAHKIVRLTSLSILVCSFCLAPSFGHAEDKTDVTSDPFSRTSLQLPGGVVVFGAPTIADLTGDGIPEVLVATTSQTVSQERSRPMRLVAVRGTTRILWQADLPAPSNSHPAVGDLDGDGLPEVVVTTGGDGEARAYQGKLVAFDHNGKLIWAFAFADFYPKDGYGDGGISSPTLCDVEGDGKSEVIVGGWDQHIYLLNSNGTPRWYNLNFGNTPAGPGFFSWDTTWSTAACADLNGDGSKEIIIGADITGGGVLPDGTRTQDGGFLYVFDKDGNVLARRFVDETVMSSPAIGDLDNDGQLEIVVGTGFYWWLVEGGRQPRVYAFSTRNVFNNSLDYRDPGKLPDLPGWPQNTAHPSYSSPALADLDGDQDLEIVMSAGDLFKGTGGSSYAWHHTGQAVTGWPLQASGPIMASPVIADVDGDNALEILMPGETIQVLNACGIVKHTLKIEWPAYFVSPAVGDTNGDGKADIWVGGGNLSGDRSSGYLWHFGSNAGTLGSLPWPQFHGDARNSGLYARPRPAEMTVGSTELLLMFDPQAAERPQQVSATVGVINTGGEAFEWTARFAPQFSTPTATVNPTEGALEPEDSAAISVQVNTREIPTTNMTYDLGQIDIGATSAGGDLPAQQVVVRLYVGAVNRIYLPMIQRQ